MCKAQQSRTLAKLGDCVTSVENLQAGLGWWYLQWGLSCQYSTTIICFARSSPLAPSIEKGVAQASIPRGGGFLRFLEGRIFLKLVICRPWLTDIECPSQLIFLSSVRKLDVPADGRRTHTWVWHMTDKFVSGFVKIRFAVGGFSISAILLPVTRYCAEERSPSLEEFKRSLDGTCSMWRMEEPDVNESDMVASDAMWRLQGTGHEGTMLAEVTCPWRLKSLQQASLKFFAVRRMWKTLMPVLQLWRLLWG